MIKNIIALACSVFSRIVINALLLIVLARYLGAENYGVLVSYLALTSLLVIVMDFGFATYVIKTVADEVTKLKPTMLKVVNAKLHLSLVYLPGRPHEWLIFSH